MEMFQYDVFLSHAAADAPAADEVRNLLLNAGFRVYCDRHDDRVLSRADVSRETAHVLRQRMRVCNAMLYVVTETAHQSKWMPWELGFFDGVRGNVLIYPVDEAARASVKAQEYLSLFTVLLPGTLEDQLRHLAPKHTPAIDTVERAPPVAPNVIDLALLRKAEIFGPADIHLTDGYRTRLRNASEAPDVSTLLNLQMEIWNAWLRLFDMRR